MEEVKTKDLRRTERNVRLTVLMSQHLNWLRQHNEELEEYERCSQLRDWMSLLSDYVMGEIQYAQVEQLLYELCKGMASIHNLEDNWVTFNFNGHLWTFEVEDAEFIDMTERLVMNAKDGKKVKRT